MDALTIALVCATFLIGGGVKGMLGLGLPLTSVALMGTFLDLRVAIPLLVIPVIVTNIWQAFRGDQMAAILRRYWVLFASSCLGIWLGTLALFSALLGRSRASSTVNTSFVERHNGMDRGQNARKRRKTS